MALYSSSEAWYPHDCERTQTRKFSRWFEEICGLDGRQLPASGDCAYRLSAARVRAIVSAVAGHAYLALAAGLCLRLSAPAANLEDRPAGWRQCHCPPLACHRRHCLHSRQLRSLPCLAVASLPAPGPVARPLRHSFHPPAGRVRLSVLRPLPRRHAHGDYIPDLSHSWLSVPAGRLLLGSCQGLHAPLARPGHLHRHGRLRLVDLRHHRRRLAAPFCGGLAPPHHRPAHLLRLQARFAWNHPQRTRLLRLVVRAGAHRPPGHATTGAPPWALRPCSHQPGCRCHGYAPACAGGSTRLALRGAAERAARPQGAGVLHPAYTFPPPCRGLRPPGHADLPDHHRKQPLLAGRSHPPAPLRPVPAGRCRRF